MKFHVTKYDREQECYTLSLSEGIDAVVGGGGGGDVGVGVVSVFADSVVASSDDAAFTSDSNSLAACEKPNQ